MSGMFYPSTNDLSSVESSKNIQNPGMKISITKDSSYVETNGKYEKTSAFSFESNILSHPEWIHLTEALSETTYKNTRCYQYKIYFEKPNPEISNQISPDLLDKIRLKGKILIDKQNMSIKKIEIFSDKDGGSSTIVEYNPLEIRPKVSIPSVD